MPAPSRAAAPPVLEVTAQGECPDANALASAFRAHGCVMGPSEWQASVRRGPGAAELELRNDAGQTVLEREIPSDDCAAIAEAAALIVEAYFVQIGVLPENRAAETGASEPPPAGASGTALPISPANTAQPVRTPPVHGGRTSTRPVATAAPARRGTGDDRAAVRGARADYLGWHAVAAVGPRADAPEIQFTGGAELGLGIDVASPGLSAELRFATAVPVVVLTPPDRVSRWPSSGLVRLGWRLGSVPVTVPWMGAGISAVRARAIDLEEATPHIVWSPLAGLGLDAWWPVGGPWFAVTGLGCVLDVRRESYIIDPEGRVGRGPRVECGAMLGALWGPMIAGKRRGLR